jgi:hypothetical protein
LIADASQVNISLTYSAGDSGAGVFLHAQIYFWPTVTKTATRSKIKKAAVLAASHLIDFI